MQLVLLHPLVAARTCEDCKTWIYNPDGTIHLRNDGSRVPRGRAKTPCHDCPKQPDDVPVKDRRPETARELSDRLKKVWTHYRRCRAVGRWPKDGLVEHHAAIIRAVEDEVAEIRRLKNLELLLSGKGK